MGDVVQISPDGMEAVRRACINAARDKLVSLGVAESELVEALARFELVFEPLFAPFPDLRISLPEGLSDDDFQAAIPFMDLVKAQTIDFYWSQLQAHVMPHAMALVAELYKK